MQNSISCFKVCNHRDISISKFLKWVRTCSCKILYTIKKRYWCLVSSTMQPTWWLLLKIVMQNMFSRSSTMQPNWRLFPKKSYGEHFSETVSETKSPTAFISYLFFRNLDCFQETSSENRVFKNSLPDKFFCVFQKIKTKTKTIQARS